MRGLDDFGFEHRTDDELSACVDGAVNGVAAGFKAAGGGLRKIQTGLVRNYALWIVLGAVLLVGYMLVRTLVGG